MSTAAGNTPFYRYLASLTMDEPDQINALAGDGIENLLLGWRWLETKRLVADFSNQLLTLG